MIYKIAISDPKFGFKIDSKELLCWWKYLCFEKGIPPKIAKKTQMRDIRDIFDISNAIAEKNMRQSEINNLMMKVR